MDIRGVKRCERKEGCNATEVHDCRWFYNMVSHLDTQCLEMFNLHKYPDLHSNTSEITQMPEKLLHVQGTSSPNFSRTCWHVFETFCTVCNQSPELCRQETEGLTCPANWEVNKQDRCEMPKNSLTNNELFSLKAPTKVMNLLPLLNVFILFIVSSAKSNMTSVQR